MNTHFTYFIILACSIAGPLALSFDKKVAFYREWKFLFPAMLAPALFYILWDMCFTANGVWSFNPAYISGIHLGNLPLEEVLFFFIVPYCCVFIYACLRAYLPQLKGSAKADIVFLCLAGVLFAAAILYHEKMYTSWTFLFTSLFIVLVLWKKEFFTGFDSLSFLVAYAIVLIPFLVVNGYLTSIPVVLYDDGENCGFRIHTIPFEDIFYGMLLVLMNIAGYEKLRSRKGLK